MSGKPQESWVASIEYIGSHPLRSDVYEVDLMLSADAGAAPTPLKLLFRPHEAMHLAHLVQLSPPRVEPKDHLLNDIARLQT